MEELQSRLVAVMNKSLDPGVAINALAHMCIGFGASWGSEKLELMDYHDADGGRHPHISKMPFIILRASGNKIRGLRLAAEEQGIDYVDFTDPMTIGTWSEQAERSKITKEEDLIYYGIVLCGDKDKVTPLIKKFSLWK